MTIEEFTKIKPTLLLDGAMGTLLQQRGYLLPSPLWSATVLENESDAITQIHREYIEAGANLITTATFRTTKYTFRKVDQENKAKEYFMRAVQCAEAARSGYEDVFIAGSVAPLEDCYQPEAVPANIILSTEHREQIFWLAEAGVDCLLFETMNTIREAEICSKIAHEIHLPFFIAFILQNPGELLSGESLGEAVSQVRGFHPMGILINCTHPEITTRSLEQLRITYDGFIGAYANAGRLKDYQEEGMGEVFTPEEYQEFVERWLIQDPVLVGGCCGTTPEHIRKLAELLE